MEGKRSMLHAGRHEASSLQPVNSLFCGFWKVLSSLWQCPEVKEAENFQVKSCHYCPGQVGPSILWALPRASSWAWERVKAQILLFRVIPSIHLCPFHLHQSQAFLWHAEVSSLLRWGKTEAQLPQRASHKVVSARCALGGPWEKNYRRVSTIAPECLPMEAWSTASAHQGPVGQAREPASSECSKNQETFLCCC